MFHTHTHARSSFLETLIHVHQEVVKAVQNYLQGICDDKSNSLFHQLRFKDFKAEDVLTGGLLLQGCVLLLYIYMYIYFLHL